MQFNSECGATMDDLPLTGERLARLRNSARAAIVIVLPAGIVAGEAPPAVRRWLAKGRARASAAREEPLSRLLRGLGGPPIYGGLAALRKWGQTGERPAGWLCAADPVYLEARLDHLCLFALRDVVAEDLAAVITDLDARLALDRDYGFSCIGRCGYLASGEPLATATVSSRIAHGERPDRFLPVGPAAAAHDRLQSELQMCLHDLELNRRREEKGRPPVNALWFWGGGEAPEARDLPLPRLFSDDPLIAGYWRSANAEPAAWPGGFAECAEKASGAFVAAPPPRADGGEEGYLEELRGLLARGEVGGLTLLFDDGLSIELERRDRLRFWKRDLPAPEASG